MPSSERQSIDHSLILQYLLGSTSEEETERLDELSITDNEFAARLEATENDLVDSYVRGELTGETLERFSSHYLSSPQHAEKVGFAAALKAHVDPAAADGSASRVTAIHRQRFHEGRFREKSLVWSFAAIAAMLVLVSGYLIHENRRVADELAQEQVRRADQKSRLAELEQRADTLEKQLEQNQTTLVRPGQTPQLLAVALAPQTRGASAPTRVTLTSKIDHVAFRLSLETDEFSSYNVKLRDIDTNQLIWRTEKLRAQSYGATRAASVVIPANVFRSGNYSLELSGASPNGAEEFVGSYIFKVAMD